MNPKAVRAISILYPFLMLLIGIGYANYDNYQIDGDAVSFMDISDTLLNGNFFLAANGYWNPAYAAALALGKMIAKPSLWAELQTYYYVNLFIFGAAIASCIYFVFSLLPLRDRIFKQQGGTPALSAPLLVLASLSFLFFSFQRELSLARVRSDSLLLCFFLLTMAFLMRLAGTGRFRYYPLIGFGLGCAYLTKSYAFLPATIILVGLFIYALFRKNGSRNRTLVGTVVAVAIFLALSGAYIAAISHQRERLTTGDSARLNYSFFIDQTQRWHEWHHGTLGRATGTFKNPEQVLVDTPPVYSYAQHLNGTYPLWFDPAFWTDGLQPQFSLSGHLNRLVRCSELLIRFLIDHLEPLLFILVLSAAGCRLIRLKEITKPFLLIFALSAVMMGIYFLIDIQDRYITFMFLLIIVPTLALFRQPADDNRVAVTVVTLLIAGLAIANSARDLAHKRRTESVAGHSGGAYDESIYSAARGLIELGIAPGDKLACMGDVACYVDHYWARLAGAQISSEVEVPNNADPAIFWTALSNTGEVLQALRNQNAKVLVAVFPNGISAGGGWQHIGTGHFYAYILKS
jgi:hypothetical protein